MINYFRIYDVFRPIFNKYKKVVLNRAVNFETVIWTSKKKKKREENLNYAKLKNVDINIVNEITSSGRNRERRRKEIRWNSNF